MTRVRAPWIFLGIAALSMPGVAAPAHRGVARQTRPVTGEEGFLALLKRGRALVARGRYAEAVAVFDAALREVPDEPRVLNELGVALRETGDLARAEAVCRAAANAAEPEVRAAALYNLGRVLERRGGTAAAIAAYKDSLQLRHARAARERLIALDPTATEEAMRTHRLEGPVPSMEQWCSHSDGLCGPDPTVVSYPDPDPDPSGEPDPTWRSGRHAPWEEVRVIVTGDCVVGLRTARGWFVDRITDCAAGHFQKREVRVQLEEEGSARPGSNVLQIELSSSDPMRAWDPVTHSTAASEDPYAAVVVCGLGPSGIPHCTSSINLLSREDWEDGARFDAYALAPSLEQGLLALVPKVNGQPCRARCDKPRLPPSLRELVGRHRVVFP